MIRTLFVDDEVDVLEGLENRLRRLRRRWDMSFACGGEEALRELDGGDFDVIVSDMRMPGMDGAALLRRVADEYPETVRIVLSGQTDNEQILRALPVAHQFLSKPCDAKLLEQSVERARSLHSMLRDERVQRLVSAVDRLPSVPHLYVKLTDAIDQSSSSLGDIASIVERDVAMTSRVLQIVNSSFFGVGRPVVDVAEAVSYLGLGALRAIVLVANLFEALEHGQTFGGFSLERLQEHSLRTANLASRLLTSKDQARTAFSAAMLLDVGRILLATSWPDYFPAVVAKATETGTSTYRAEMELHGFSHAEVGGALLALWGIPYSIVEAVVYHHRPSDSHEDAFGVIGAVHVADRLVSELELEERGEASRVIPAIDEPYVERVAVEDDLAAWRKVAADLSGNKVCDA